MERITSNIQGWTQSVHVNYGYAWYVTFTKYLLVPNKMFKGVIYYFCFLFFVFCLCCGRGSGSGGSQFSLDEVVLHVTLEVEIGEFILLVKLEKLG